MPREETTGAVESTITGATKLSRDGPIASAAMESVRAGLHWFPPGIVSLVMQGKGGGGGGRGRADAEEEPPPVQAELYVTSRQFRAKKSFIGRLPRSAKDALSVGGVCHFLCVFRSERGELWQMDFGPFGGDIHSRLLSDAKATQIGEGEGEEREGAETAVLGSTTVGDEGSRRRRSKSSSSSNSTPGHIREKLLLELPREESVLYIGPTSMTLAEVRAFNATRNTTYNVNKNDCRHYVNDLCRLGTGVEGACSKYVQGLVWGRDMVSSSTHATPAVTAAAMSAEASHDDDNDDNGPSAKYTIAGSKMVTVEQRRRRKRELAVLLPISMITDLENTPLWDRLGRASSAALVIGIGVRAIPPALLAIAASRAAASAGASVGVARQAGAGMGAAAAGVGAAAEAGGWMVRAAAVTQPLVAPTVRRLVTTAAGVVGGTREDIADSVWRGRERAARLLSSFRSGLIGRPARVRRSPTGIGRVAVVPAVGWAGRGLTAQHASAAGTAAAAGMGKGR